MPSTSKVVDEAVRATMKRLVNFSMKNDQDQDAFVMQKTLARSELDKKCESIPDRKFKDIFLQGFTADDKGIKPTMYLGSTYKDIKPTMYLDSTFDIEHIMICRALCVLCT